MIGPRPVDPAQQTQSTKHLIQRFESMRQPSQSSSRRVSSRSKEVRSSFQNLFGLLKKGASKLNLAMVAPRESSISSASVSDLLDSVYGSKDTQTKGNPMLYLDKSSTVPVWITCSTVLGDEAIAISSITTQGNPRVQSISLLGCTDVRSMTLDELDPDENRMLPPPSEGEDFRAFELLFDNGTRERLVAFSVKDRAGWVNAIWDIVLSLKPVRKTKIPSRSLPLPPPKLKRVPSPTGPVLDIAPPKDMTESPSTPEPQPKLAPYSQVTSPSWDARVTTPIMSPPISLGYLESTPERSSGTSYYSTHQPPTKEPLDSKPQPPRPSVLLDNKPPPIVDRYLNARSNAETDVPVDPGLVSLLGTLQTHVLRQFDLCTTINEQLTALQDDMDKQRTLYKKASAASTQDRDHEKLSATVLKLETYYKTLDDVVDTLRTSKLVTPTRDAPELEKALESVKTLVRSELAAITTKLERIEELGPANTVTAANVAGCSGASSDLSGLNEKTTQLVQLVNAVQHQGDSQMTQAADNARYLTELNTWLESFVANGMSQIQSIAGSVDYLCKQLAGDPTGALPGTVFASIRQLAYEVEVREKSNGAIYEAINALSVGVANATGNTSMVAGQQQWMEALIRQATSDVIEEVRGERIRFVDAMKEATAINVQAHVEQFKEDLKAEVCAAANEIGRLNQEKLQMEGKLGELATLYASQQYSQFAVPRRSILQSRGDIVHGIRGPSPD